MYKLKKENKNILALFMTLTLFGIKPDISIAKPVLNLDGYYENNRFIIDEYGNYKLSITKEQLEKLIESSDEDSIEVVIGDSKSIISKDTLIMLKNQAEQLEKNKIEYSIFLSLGFGGIIVFTMFKESKKIKTIKK